MNEIIPIVGAGPAGIAAAIQLQRQGFHPMLLEAHRPGGLLWNARRVENYPGFPRGITGPALVKKMIRQMENLDVDCRLDPVVQVNFDQKFTIQTEKATYSSRRMIFASGTRAHSFHLLDDAGQPFPYETDIVSIVKTRGKRIAIIGGGDAAFDYALNLSRKNRVTLLHRSHRFKALPLLMEEAKRNPSIEIMTDVAVGEVVRKKKGNLLVFTGIKSGNRHAIPADIIIAAVGRLPDTRYYSQSIRENKEILIASGKLFIIGDVQNNQCRQVAIAAGDGLRAAMAIGKQQGSE